MQNYALYRIVLETNTIFMLYLFNQIILLFHFSSTMFVQKSFKFSITDISSSYDICSASQNQQYFTSVDNFLSAKTK